MLKRKNSKGRKLIENAGGCLVSKNILSGKGKVKWCFREEGIAKQDCGWRFLSDIDTDEYTENPDNFSICDYDTVAQIEPAVLCIYHLPIGSDLVFVDDGSRRFYDAKTGKELRFVFDEKAGGYRSV